MENDLAADLPKLEAGLKAQAVERSSEEMIKLDIVLDYVSVVPFIIAPKGRCCTS